MNSFAKTQTNENNRAKKPATTPLIKVSKAILFFDLIELKIK